MEDHRDVSNPNLLDIHGQEGLAELVNYLKTVQMETIYNEYLSILFQI